MTLFKQCMPYLSLLIAMMVGVTAVAQVEYKVEMADDSTYQLVLRPLVDWEGPKAMTASAQITMLVPTGGFRLENLQNVTGIWTNNSNIVAPKESPEFDYITVGLTSLATRAIVYKTGEEVVLFSFENGGTCTGAIELMKTDDPFLPPNSHNTNVGNQITTLGSGNINAWNGPYEMGSANCEEPLLQELEKE